MASEKEKVLNRFREEVDAKGPGGRHGRLQKLCGQYLIEDGGPLKRKLWDIHAEREIIGKKKKDTWPADIFVKWNSSYSEIVEVEASGSQKKFVTVNYSDVEDALGKIEYLEKHDMISQVESRSVLRRVENKSGTHGITASYFRFRPFRSSTIGALLDAGWDIDYESPLERKLRLAKSNDTKNENETVVSFCVPLRAYKDVLSEIRRTPGMKVGVIYPFTEGKDGGELKIAGAIPVFQGIDLKAYGARQAKKER